MAPQLALRMGVALSSTQPAKELLALARRAEELNFDSLWLAEIYHYRSVMPLAAAIGAATSRIRIGLGVIPTHTRHPGLVAMECATLDELTNQRFALGLGVGQHAAERHGVVSGVAGLEEAIRIIQGLLDGKEVTLKGKAWQIEGVRLAIPSRRTPIYVGCYPYSPRALRIVGALADGVEFVYSTPDAIRRAQETIAEGAHAAGRDPAAVDIGASIFIGVDDDEARARAAVKPSIVSYAHRLAGLAPGMGPVSRDEMEPVLAAIRTGGAAAGAAAVTDSMVEKLAIAGNAAYCVDRLKEFKANGLAFVVASGSLGSDPVASLEPIRKLVA